MTETTFVDAASIYRGLRKKGITIRKTNDCIIAATAIHHRLVLLHFQHGSGVFGRNEGRILIVLGLCERCCPAASHQVKQTRTPPGMVTGWCVRSAKPQAFRYSQHRDELLRSAVCADLWVRADAQFDSRAAYKWMVAVLRFACEDDCETAHGTDTAAEPPVPHPIAYQVVVIERLMTPVYPIGYNGKP